MKQRGRPKTPGVLTPRELEVLELLRNGMSNREIAERLGISLAGAKFHVSEIITKLGVSSREEAALWRPKLPVIVLLSFKGWPRWFPGRLAAAAGASAALVLTGALFALAMGNRGPDPSQTVVAPTATPQGMIRMDYRDVGSVGEAQRLATFDLVMPAGGLPEYRITSVRYFKPDFRCPAEVDANHCARVHNDHVIVRFEADSGRWFTYTQGYGAPIGVASHHFAPEVAKGNEAVDGREIHWVKGHMRPGIAPHARLAAESDWVFDSSITCPGLNHATRIRRAAIARAALASTVRPSRWKNSSRSPSRCPVRWRTPRKTLTATAAKIAM